MHWTHKCDWMTRLIQSPESTDVQHSPIQLNVLLSNTRWSKGIHTATVLKIWFPTVTTHILGLFLRHLVDPFIQCDLQRVYESQERETIYIYITVGTVNMFIETTLSTSFKCQDMQHTIGVQQGSKWTLNKWVLLLGDQLKHPPKGIYWMYLVMFASRYWRDRSVAFHPVYNLRVISVLLSISLLHLQSLVRLSTGSCFFKGLLFYHQAGHGLAIKSHCRIDNPLVTSHMGVSNQMGDGSIYLPAHPVDCTNWGPLGALSKKHLMLMEHAKV
jgi:hypothetical protein